VNQDSAMPAALGQLQRAYGDTRYDAAITRGLLWEIGNNESRTTLIDEHQKFVARSLALQPQVHCSWDMYGYQPARFVYTVLSNLEWASENPPTSRVAAKFS
jgi:hypothetical protein